MERLFNPSATFHINAVGFRTRAWRLARTCGSLKQRGNSSLLVLTHNPAIIGSLSISDHSLIFCNISILTGYSEGQFNLNGRSTRDAIVVMNPETLEFKELPITGYTGTDGDGVISIVGFTGIDKPDGSIELFLTNFRPSIDLSSGQVLPDQAAVGANATIEVFKIDPRIEGLQYVQTLADPAIMTPNRIAAVPDRGLYITNDHGLRKTGLVGSSIVACLIFLTWKSQTRLTSLVLLDRG